MNANLSETRMTRGMEIAQSSTITMNSDGTFWVPSQTVSGATYHVDLTRGTCTCPDQAFRHIECKHIYAATFYSGLTSPVQPAPKVVAPDAPKCKFCESIRVIRYGFKSGSQQFKCKDCQRAFVEESPFKKLKFDPEIITVCLDLYFKGISLRKISDHLKQMYSIEINFSTIYHWLERYVGAMDDYVSTPKPKLGIHGTWTR
jgi:transposase-like protein